MLVIRVKNFLQVFLMKLGIPSGPHLLMISQRALRMRMRSGLPCLLLNLLMNSSSYLLKHLVRKQ